MIPLELIDLICVKINLKLLVKISTENLFEINKKRIENYWRKVYREPYWKKDHIENIIENGDFRGFKNILNLNIKHDIDGYLIMTCENGQLEILKYLVSLGANPCATNDDPLISASEYGHLETVKYLIEQGADITAQNNISIYLAVEWGHLETVKFLAEKYNLGEKMIVKNSFRIMILRLIDFAEQEKHFDIVEYLKSLHIQYLSQ
jgi:hypothetical protein